MCPFEQGVELYLVSNKELRNDVVVDPNARGEVEDNQPEVQRGNRHFADVYDFQEAVQVVMHQVEEAVYDPKISACPQCGFY